ncbi:MAG: DUF3054 domain-containing protein [Caldilineales bacterium]|nr:DUF3054 domain-containing protein [Caldilineales bacterium]MCW5861399.1 DUF3054 domain-containing protein [Caldilineales bacterium]
MPRSSFLLPLGDALTILLFAVLGRQSHNEAASNIAAAFKVAAPFIIGWLFIAPWLGALRPPAWASLRSAAAVVLKAFVPAYVAGSLLRALSLGRFSPPAFYLVTAAVILALLLGWRWVYTLAVAPRLGRA